MTTSGNLRAIVPAAGSSRRLAHLTRDRPKSLLEVQGRPLLASSLGAIAARGVREVLIIVGYRHQDIETALGTRTGAMTIEYVLAEDYATTEHGHSLNLAQAWWRRDPGPVLLVDADNVYDPALLDPLLDADAGGVVLVDPELSTEERDEELVLGGAGLVTGLVRGRADAFADTVGGFVGINRLDAETMAGYFDLAGPLLRAHARKLKYERILDAVVRARPGRLRYRTVSGADWVNVNFEADLARAQALAAR